MEFAILGPLRVGADGHELDLGGAKRRALVCLLVVHANGPVGSERLAEELWEGRPPPSAAATLHSHISQVRKTLGAGRLLSRPGGYELVVADGELDAALFEVEVSAGRAALAAGDPAEAAELVGRGLARWRGPALADGAGAAWAAGEVARLGELRLVGHETLLEARLAAGDAAQVVGLAEAAVTEAPLRERLWGLLMLAMYRCGRQAEALRAYQRLRSHLGEELGIEPSAELAGLEQAILLHQPELAWQPPRHEHRAHPPSGADPERAAVVVGEPEELRLPSGVVTFVLTDMVASTAMWDAHPQAMAEIVARHDRLISEDVAAHGGTVLKTKGEGDATMSVFARASDGLAAAIGLQQALGAEQWPKGLQVGVRVAVHTGEAHERDGDYYGPALNRCARLRAVAHGGQVLLSQATAELVRHQLPKGASVDDLGVHRLKDLAAPERVFQILHPGLMRSFPALRTLDSFPGNLPVQVSSFVGRDREVQRTCAALGEVRIVTLTGVGGVGKTRLALQVAAQVLPRFREGAWLVELAPVRDPAGIAGAIAAVFGVTERAGMTLEQSLVEFLRTKQLLMILDNCEHVLEPVAEIVERLAHSCRGLVVLATSREGLALEGERVLPVPSLAGPAADAIPEAAMKADAVRLFMDRANAVDPDFSLTAANVPTVVEVCRRLDGIPLAIELAAARVGAMTLSELVAGLDRRFETLAGGRRRAVQRHQTLRAAIDWSYELLSEDERRLLARLAVFAGGCTRQAAEAVCGGEPLVRRRVFELLASLVAKSLVVAQRDEPETRYRLLETLREYGEQRLADYGETQVLRAAHAQYYCQAAAAQSAERFGPREIAVLRFLTGEQENLLAALNHAIDTEDVDLVLRLVRWTWGLGQTVTAEVNLPFDAALRLPGATEHPLYPHGLAFVALRATFRGELAGVDAVCEEALAAAARLGSDSERVVEEVVIMTRSVMAMAIGAWGEAARLAERAAEIVRSAGRADILPFRLGSVAALHSMAGNLDAALPWGTEGLDLARQAGAPMVIAGNLVALAGALAGRDPSQAQALLQESVQLHDRLRFWTPRDATQTTLVAARLEDWSLVLDLGPRSIRDLHWNGDRPQLAGILNVVARAVAPADAEAAAVLQGAARRLASGTTPPPSSGVAGAGGGGDMPTASAGFSFVRELRRQTTALIRDRLDEPQLHDARAKGEAMDEDSAVAYALDAIARERQRRVPGASASSAV